MPFWNQWKGENGHRNFFMSKSQRKNVLPDVTIEPATVPGCVSDRATTPGSEQLLWVFDDNLGINFHKKTHVVGDSTEPPDHMFRWRTAENHPLIISKYAPHLFFCYKWQNLTKWSVRPAKTQIRLGGCPGWSESSLGAQIILLVLSWGYSIVLLL